MKLRITINKTALLLWFLVSLIGHDTQFLNVQYLAHHIEVILLQQKSGSVVHLSIKVHSTVTISAALKAE